MMDEQGIGTDATIAQHIKKTLDRGYVEKRVPNNTFHPLPLSRILLDSYTRMPQAFDLGVPHLRAEMERDMAPVASAELARRGRDACDV